jgi:hypothetical protein
MEHKFGAAVLVIAAFFGAVTAVTAAARPEWFAGQLGLKIANVGGVSEIRAQYAGFFLAVALVCAAALLGWLPRQTGFVVLATVFGGLIVSRLISLAINGGVAGFGPTIRALYLVDSVGFALSTAAFIMDNRAVA